MLLLKPRAAPKVELKSPFVSHLSRLVHPFQWRKQLVEIYLCQ